LSGAVKLSPEHNSNFLFVPPKRKFGKEKARASTARPPDCLSLHRKKETRFAQTVPGLIQVTRIRMVARHFLTAHPPRRIFFVLGGLPVIWQFDFSEALLLGSCWVHC
jgi:hypothetical protein